MTIRKIYLASMLALTTISCQNSDTIADVSPDEIFRQTNIYPQPPNQWMGTGNSYYTAGYVGDVMPYYENGSFHLFFLHDAKTKPAGEGFHDIHSLKPLILKISLIKEDKFLTENLPIPISQWEPEVWLR